MYVLGAGLSRNGTRSMKIALEMLYPGKCYHGFEVLEKGHSHNRFWHQVHSDSLSDDEIRQWFAEKNYVAGVDCPFSGYVRKFLKIYPNAKVVLNVRDPKKWYLSVKRTIIPLVEDMHRFPTSLISPLDPKMIDLGRCDANLKPGKDKGLIGSVEAGEEAAVKFYQEWIDTLKAEIPPEKLLIYDVKDGWEPLCKFLEVPVPNKPFPNVNDTNEMLRKVKLMRFIAWFIVVVLPLICAGGLFAFFRRALWW